MLAKYFALLGLASLCAALPSRPVAPLRAPGSALRLKGGNCPHLLPSTAAIIGVQGGMLAMANSGTTEKLYGLGIELDALDKAMMETWGLNMLAFTATLVGVHQGLSLSKAMTAPLLLCIIGQYRWANTHANIPGAKINEKAMYMWMLIAAAMSYLSWNEGAGLIDGSDLVKYWGLFVAANSLFPLLALDKFASTYGITLEGDIKRNFARNTFSLSVIPSALFLLFAGDSTSKGLGAAWSAIAVQMVWWLVGQHWRIYKMPNGIPHFFWLALSIAGAYSAFKMA